ncbi:MAG: lysophospholipase [Myxococcota bacterium]|nr:lysophospholipase [Myxococcota bacterium]
MKRTESEYIARDGTPLFYRTWLPEGGEGLRGIVCVVHGLGEHGDRYGEMADALAAGGFAVVSCDHRGHGRSGGLRGHCESFDDYVADLCGFIATVQELLGTELPTYLLGHSMGGLIAVRTLQTRTDLALAGAIISNPCLEVAVQAPRLKVAMARGLAKLLPRLRLDNELTVEDICRDPAVVTAYEADPLIHRKISARWYTALLQAMELAGQDPPSVAVPTLWILSGQDRICDSEVSESFARQLPAHRVTVRRFPEAFHEAHNGPDKGEVLSAVLGWLGEQVSGLEQPHPAAQPTSS